VYINKCLLVVHFTSSGLHISQCTSIPRKKAKEKRKKKSGKEGHGVYPEHHPAELQKVEEVATDGCAGAG
jgi:hypothetical protein